MTRNKDVVLVSRITEHWAISIISKVLPNVNYSAPNFSATTEHHSKSAQTINGVKHQTTVRLHTPVKQTLTFVVLGTN